MTAHPLDTDPVAAAQRLLGAVITAGGVCARVVETEAYGGPADGPWPDEASHSYRGPTRRNAVMFGPPGRLYVYRSHGIHLCANVSCGPAGVASAVLLRAAVIESGTGAAHARRGPTATAITLARGPGNLCAALGIEIGHDGTEVFAVDSPVRLRLADPLTHVRGPRVGVSRAADRQWRFWLPGSPEVSAYRRSARAPRPGASG